MSRQLRRAWVDDSPRYSYLRTPIAHLCVYRTERWWVWKVFTAQREIEGTQPTAWDAKALAERCLVELIKEGARP